MRLIGTLNDEKKGLTFSLFLHQKGIEHQLDIQPNTDWGSSDYGSSLCYIWIQDEDQVEEAVKWYDLFKEHPLDPIFHVTPSLAQDFTSSPSQNRSTPPPPISPKQTKVAGWEKQPMGWMTRSFLIICCLLFLAAQLIKSSPNASGNVAVLTIVSSPIDKTFLYDYPQFYELVDRFIRFYGYEGLENTKDLPKAAQTLLQKIEHTPFWQGFYHLALSEGFQKIFSGHFGAPLFEKISEGQIWRLFSPALLHGDIFHLFFNMLWLIVLGKQIEQRMSPGRYLFFILIAGVFSNTAQYLMSGPNFVGFSGILCAMLTFIWIRQQQAPWEGYQLDRLTVTFMLIFIIGMALLQSLSFFLEKFFELGMSPNIANTAHLSGAFIGLLLGKLNFFSWRHT